MNPFFPLKEQYGDKFPKDARKISKKRVKKKSGKENDSNKANYKLKTKQHLKKKRRLNEKWNEIE